MTQAWWRGASLYQIYPLSFCDSNGDGWGDLPGVTSRLDHVASLGVDGIWLSPFFKSPMNDFGYDCEDFLSVDPRLGTLADFDALVARAHALGLKVLIDQVYTYSSNRHPWFEESRSSRSNARHDWYVWADAKPDGTPPNNWQSMFGGPAWEWDSRRRQYYMTHFYPEMPHLNVNKPEVQDALLEVADFWLARGVDGFRLDVINIAMVDPLLRDNPPVPGGRFNTPNEAQQHLHDRSQPQNLAFVRRLRERLDAKPGRHSLAEFTVETPRDRNLAYLSPGHIDTAYFVVAPEEKPITPAPVRALVQEVLGSGSWPTWAFSNHDSVRGPTRCAQPGVDDPRLAEMLVAMLVCLRGNLLIYQGDELGLPHAQVPREKLRDREGIRFYPEGLKRDGARTPMPWHALPPLGAEPWLPYDPRHLNASVEAQREDPHSTLKRAARWLGLRREIPALRTADLAFVDVSEPLLAWTRSEGTSQWLCMFNLGAVDVSVERAGVPSHARVIEASAGVELHGGVLTLPPCGAALLSL
jgi:alpha-glucosidase